MNSEHEQSKPRRVWDRLTSPAMPWWAAAVAALVVLPSLAAGWAIDDYVHRRFLLDSMRFPWDLYGFLKGDPAAARELIQAGQLPWWTLEPIRISFFRPLASLTQWLDYRLWPDSAALMHAHSIAWFAACIWIAGRLYRRLLGPTVAAGLAMLLFAVDDAHHLPVVWIANRNVLPAFFFGMLALWAHDRWRRAGWRGGSVIGPVALALSLFSAEAGVATVGYLAAHALVLDPQGRRSRCLALIPYVVVIIAWRMVYGQLGYGTWGSGFYTDPATEPLHFLACVVQRAPLLLVGQFVLPPTTALDGVVAMFGPRWSWSVIAAVVLLPVIVLLWPLLRQPTNRFWLLGMLCALVPVSATIPMTRLLFFAGLGGCALVAEFLVAVCTRSAALPAGQACRRLALGVAAYFVLIHLIAAPIQLAVQSRHVLPPDIEPRLFIKTPMAEADVERTVILMNSPSVFHARHSGVMNAIDGLPFPGRMYALAPSWTDVVIRRPDARTLVVTPSTGYLVRPLDVLFRGAHHPIPLDTPIALEGLTVSVTALTSDGRPAEATFEFDQPLEDATWYWFHYVDNAYAPSGPPPIGGTLELAAPRL